MVPLRLVVTVVPCTAPALEAALLVALNGDAAILTSDRRSRLTVTGVALLLSAAASAVSKYFEPATMLGTEALLVKLSVAVAAAPVIPVGSGGTKVTSTELVAPEAKLATVESRSVPDALHVVPALALMVEGDVAAPLATTFASFTPTPSAVSGPAFLTPKCNCMVVLRLVAMVVPTVDAVAALLVALNVCPAMSIFACR